MWDVALALRGLVVGSSLCGVALAIACSATGGGSDIPGGAASGGSAGSSAGSAGNAGSGFGAFGGTAGVLGTGGGGNTGGIEDGGECAAVSQTADNEFKPVDIIMAIDNSGSMTFEAQEVQNNMNTFATAILSQGIDVRVVVISQAGPPNVFTGSNGVCVPTPLGSGQCPNDSKAPQYFRVDDEVASNNALQKMLDDYPQYKPTLRQKSSKYFAVVTDDESDMDAQTFINSVGTLDPGWFDSWRFFGVYCTGNCGVLLACAATGTVYTSLCQQSGTTPGDLCQGQSNFAGVFTQLAQTVATGTQLACEWAIPPPPAGQQFESDKVNVTYTPGGGGPPQDIYFVQSAADCGAQGGWYYDNSAAPTKIIACPSTCAGITNDLQGKIDILFGCFTISVPK